jgi:tellurite methyltransferase
MVQVENVSQPGARRTAPSCIRSAARIKSAALLQRLPHMSQEDRDKWNARYADAEDAGPDSPGNQFRGLLPPHSFVVAQGPLLPRGGSAMDVAGGVGRHAIWLAQEGMDVTLVDISHRGLEHARDFAREQGVPLRTLEHDAADDGLPPGQWDVILSSYFLRRELFSQFPQRLKPGGLLIFVHPTVTNLQRNNKPPRDFLLEDKEIPQLLQGLEIVSYEEGWFGDAGDERYEAQLVARKPQAGN